MFSSGSVCEINSPVIHDTRLAGFSSVVADLHSGTRECNAGHYKNRPHSPLRHATCGKMNTKTSHSQSLEYFKVNQIK